MYYVFRKKIAKVKCWIKVYVNRCNKNDSNLKGKLSCMVQEHEIFICCKNDVEKL